jgi:hypothetical protein
MSKRGRPKEWDSNVSFRLSSDLHDKLCREATDKQIDVSDVIRDRLRLSYCENRQDKKTA